MEQKLSVIVKIEMDEYGHLSFNFDVDTLYMYVSHFGEKGANRLKSLLNFMKVNVDKSLISKELLIKNVSNFMKCRPNKDGKDITRMKSFDDVDEYVDDGGGKPWLKIVKKEEK